MTIAREETVWLPRPGAVWPVEEEIFLKAHEEASSREWPELADATSIASLGRPSLIRLRRGRHRVPARWGLRVGLTAAGLAVAASAFGTGWALGQSWSRDGGQSIARQFDTWRAEVRDTLLGV